MIQNQKYVKVPVYTQKLIFENTSYIIFLNKPEVHEAEIFF